METALKENLEKRYVIHTLGKIYLRGELSDYTVNNSTLSGYDLIEQAGRAQQQINALSEARDNMLNTVMTGKAPKGDI